VWNVLWIRGRVADLGFENEDVGVVSGIVSMEDPKGGFYTSTPQSLIVVQLPIVTIGPLSHSLLVGKKV
jgi:hypothetical protein